MKSNRRRKDLAEHLRILIPLAPMADFIEIQQVADAGHLRHLPITIAAWQAVTTRARHAHTDYDTLLADGYDQDSARHFVVDDMNDILETWGCTKRVDVNIE